MPAAGARRSAPSTMLRMVPLPRCAGEEPPALFPGVIMTKLVANWSYPTAVRFGAGRIVELPEACRAAGISKPLFVTDAGLAKLDVTARALDILQRARLTAALFSDVKPNPVESNLTAGVAAFRAGGHDGVVAF